MTNCVIKPLLSVTEPTKCCLTIVLLPTLFAYQFACTYYLSARIERQRQAEEPVDYAKHCETQITSYLIYCTKLNSLNRVNARKIICAVSILFTMT